VCNWLYYVGQNHFYVMMLLYREAVLSIFYTYVLFFKKTLCRFQGSYIRFPYNRLDDVIFHPNAQLSKHHPSGRRELSVRTFLCVEKFCTIPACICPDVSAARSDASQCLISYEISFQNTDMRRQLQPSGRCVFSSERAHS
jgi:hypothetical protein